jgi:hypothetical protein
MPKQIDILNDGRSVVTGVVDALHSLASSNDPGKVKIDPDTGTMTVNNSYSTSEQATGETWIDGKPIYRRVFTGTITAAVNELVTTNLIDGTANIKMLVAVGGEIQHYSDDNAGFAVGNPIITGSDSYPKLGSSILRTNTNGLNLYSRSAWARSDDPYIVWVEYTKIAD